ncbi:MAG: hypothetical protein ACREU8_12955 [Gammaproteobacteria bacterium]
MDDIVDSEEAITRYLRNSGHMRPALGRPHYSAFLPRVPDGDISVYRTVDLTSAETCTLGAQYVGKPDCPLKGHCDLAAGEFFSEKLNVVSAPNPHERHANVNGWTVEAKNRIVAKKLADKAALTVYQP